MCWLEKQIPNSPLCGALAAPEILVLGCPFGLARHDCNLIFETTVNIIRAHASCVSLDQLCRDVRMGVPPRASPAPVHVDSRMDVDPLGPPSYDATIQTPTPPREAVSLPVGWTADNVQATSDALNLATQHRDALVRMVENLIPDVQSLNATVAPLDDRLRVVIEWCEGYMTGMVVAANTHIASVQAAEFEIANNTVWSDQASMDIAIIVDGIVNHLSPFEGAFIWNARLTDLFVHLRRMAGQLSPPRPATDELPPLMGRRGATAGIEDSATTDHSDSLPDPTFYLLEDAFSDDGEAMDEDFADFDAYQSLSR